MSLKQELSKKLNSCMHPRNIYKNNPPNFTKLSEFYDEFKLHVKTKQSGKSFVNFRDPAAVRTLAKCLLHKDFGLDVHLPTDRLAPTIPSRLNYVLWVEDLLNAISRGDEKYFSSVIDIGTGSSCVYPLLGVRTNSNLRFTATEVDDVNFKNAIDNVTRNGLNECIEVLKVEKETQTLLKHLFNDENSSKTFDCCMCNPPFFSTVQDMNKREPRSVANSSCHAGMVEAVVEGGDSSFATRLLEESLELKNKVTWYTILFGKKKSFLAIKKKISSLDGVLWTSYDFCQGNTVRWGIGWTFCPQDIDITKLPESPLKLASKAVKASKPICFTLSNQSSLSSCHKCLMRHLENLGVKHEVISQNEIKIKVHLEASKATWVNVRQRARKRKHDGDVVDGEESAISQDSDLLLDCEIEIVCNVEGKIDFSFTSSRCNQRNELNGLVIHLKRLLSN